MNKYTVRRMMLLVSIAALFMFLGAKVVAIMSLRQVSLIAFTIVFIPYLISYFESVENDETTC